MILMISRMVARLVTASLVVYWLLLLLGTHVPSPPLGGVHVSDKWLHFLAYLGLAFLLACTFTVYRRPCWKTYLYLAAIVLAYGALDELAQLPIAGRTADFQDWLADAMGAAVGLTLHRIALAVYEHFTGDTGRSTVL